ncbi:MAG: endonuclease NucS [Rhodospirillales bacterium]
MTTLYRIDGGRLKPVQRTALASEDQLERWIAENPGLVGLDVLVLGRQIITDYNGRIDILAMDREGGLVVIELKRDRTPRDIVAQILDYASWVSSLTTKRVYEITLQKQQRRLEEIFRERFDSPLPETLNGTHSLMIVASEFDASSSRIVEYLAEEHGVSINTAFFTVFEENGTQLLATDWLMDQQEVVERAESRKKAPWSGYYYVNAGDLAGYRSWEDMRRHGFVAAGGGPFYSKRLFQLSEGDQFYAYNKGAGYVGFGVVRETAVMARDYRLDDGTSLRDLQLKEPALLHDSDNPELCEYLVKVDWKKAVPTQDAMTFNGVFANQNIVCKLRDPATLDFLAENFGS